MIPVQLPFPWTGLATASPDRLKSRTPRGGQKAATPVHYAGAVSASCPTASSALVRAAFHSDRIEASPCRPCPTVVPHNGRGLLLPLPCAPCFREASVPSPPLRRQIAAL